MPGSYGGWQSNQGSLGGGNLRTLSADGFNALSSGARTSSRGPSPSPVGHPQNLHYHHHSSSHHHQHQPVPQQFTHQHQHAVPTVQRASPQIWAGPSPPTVVAAPAPMRLSQGIINPLGARGFAGLGETPISAVVGTPAATVYSTQSPRKGTTAILGAPESPGFIVPLPALRPHVNHDIPARPPALNLVSVPVPAVSLSVVQQAIRDKHKMKVPVDQVVPEDSRPFTQNISQVLLNLQAIRDVCSVPWLTEVMAGLSEHLAGVASALKGSAGAQDHAFASVADSLVGELLRVLSFSSVDAKVTASLSQIASDIKASIAAIEARREAGAVSGDAGIPALLAKVPLYLEMEKIGGTAAVLHSTRQLQAGDLMRSVFEELRVSGETTLGSISKVNTTLAESVAHDLQLLERAKEEEKAEFASVQQGIQTLVEKQNDILEKNRADQRSTQAEIERLQAHLGNLRREEADRIQTLNQYEAKRLQNEAEHHGWAEDCQAWARNLAATARTANQRVVAAKHAGEFVAKASACIAKRYAEVVEELKVLQADDLKLQLEAARGSIISLGRILNTKLNTRDALKADLEAAVVESQTHGYRNSPRKGIWEHETHAIDRELSALSAEIARIESEFSAANARFSSLEKSLKQARIPYTSPGDDLLALLEKEAQLEEDRRQKIDMFRQQVRSSIHDELATGTSGNARIIESLMK